MPPSLSTLLDRSAERAPDREAFRCGGHSLTYAAAANRSDRLAQTLLAHGVAKGNRVGLYLDKSLELAVALFGIMKAGAAYVPLDPAAPLGRLEYMINHCGIQVVVSAANKQAQLCELGRRCPALETVVGPAEVDDSRLRAVGWDEVDATPARPPLCEGKASDLAYIMFTSGSTGMPKGIMHTHESGFAYARAAMALYEVGPDDRLGNHSPLHFDMSTFDYFSGPLAGATTVIIPEAYKRMPASLSQLMEKERLTFWYSVPFALIQLLLRGVLEKRDLSALRWVMFGGEPFPPKYLRALMEQWPQARFSNVYGPAEVNQCTYYHVSAMPSDPAAPIPIGRIWDAAEGLVLDESDGPVPTGGAGELAIRSATMMRGYWNRPDLNECAFYRPSLADRPYYRTGDLVRADAEGTLYFLGRKDRLVKLRGYRVELDEVELALVRHGAVEEAAALVSVDELDAPELKAAVILKPDMQVDEAALVAFVADHMPPYGVPRRVHVRNSFPRTASGKIDRPALCAELSHKDRA